jgi:hypothetical protein
VSEIARAKIPNQSQDSYPRVLWPFASSLKTAEFVGLSCGKRQYSPHIHIPAKK